VPHPYPKRLIEVDLPIKRIYAHARREKSIRHGHISTLHIWWARRPLAACRAVICAALWPDPADEHCPPEFLPIARRLMQTSAKRFCSTREGAAELMADIDNDLRSSDVKKRQQFPLKNILLQKQRDRIGPGKNFRKQLASYQ
jgi:putative DNA methylase